jgi:hypothetical protein
MAFKLWFLCTDGATGTNPGIGDIKDFINEQERWPMRNNLVDIFWHENY